DRYVIPTGYTARHSEHADPGTGCSLDGEGGPGMYTADTFHAPLAGPDPDPEPVPGATGSTGSTGSTGPTGSLSGRVNLLNWNGQGAPAGLFPRREQA
ncbi:nitrate reductase subunit beta, partial [Streptomyces sp. NBC_00320]|nr:nitrate reductase subunit beta [Streptomyces sp. NBC_00320]